MTTYQTHPLAELWPIFDDVLDELTESIRANGLRFPITVTPDGLVIDGRTRLKACEQAGVEPEFTVYNGNDIITFIEDANSQRRHMSLGARMLTVAEMMAKEGLRHEGRWQYSEATANYKGSYNSGSRQSYLAQAGVVLDYTPHLVEQVKRGDLTFNAALDQAKAVKASAEAEKLAERNRARAEREAEKAEAERQQRLLDELKTNTATQFLTYIDRGEMDIPTAHAAWCEATRKQREEARQMDHTRKKTMQRISDALTTLSGGASYAHVVWENAYPHEHRLMDEHEHLTVDRIQTAINYLTALKEHLQ